MSVIINGSNTPTAGGVTYGNGTEYATTSAGTSGQALISAGASAPTWGALGISGGGTNSTATPTAGGVGYGTGTAHAYTSAGTTGQVLTSAGASAPTWATPATGALVYLGGVSASGASTVDLNGYFSSTYDEYVIIASNVTFSGGVQMQCRARIAGSYPTTNYSYKTTYTGGLSSSQAQMVILDLGTTTGIVFSFNVSISRPASTQYKAVVSTYSFNDNSDVRYNIGVAGYNGATTAWDGFRFLPNAGTLSGEFRLYGIAKS